jgi:hypothetical protein
MYIYISNGSCDVSVNEVVAAINKSLRPKKWYIPDANRISKARHNLDGGSKKMHHYLIMKYSLHPKILFILD